jgi:hypothetical protein
MQGRFLRQIINKFMVNSEVANNARVQVYMPNGETFDVKGIQLMQNKIIGERESHRLIITVEPKKALGPCTIKLYEGSKILELHERVPCSCVAESWPKIQEYLVNVT